MTSNYVDKLKEVVLKEQKRISQVQEEIKVVDQEISSQEEYVRVLLEKYSKTCDISLMDAVELVNAEIEKLKRRKSYMVSSTVRHLVKTDEGAKEIFDKIIESMEIQKKKKAILEANREYLKAVNEYDLEVKEFTDMVVAIKQLENYLDDDYLKEIVKNMRECTTKLQVIDLRDDLEIKRAAGVINDVDNHVYSLLRRLFDFRV